MRRKVFQVAYRKNGRWRLWSTNRLTFAGACEACEALKAERPDIVWKPHYYTARLPEDTPQ